jgi:hypothetical protein
VVAQPHVLGFSCESNISPLLAALLQSRLSLSDAQLQKVVVARAGARLQLRVEHITVSQGAVSEGGGAAQAVHELRRRELRAASCDASGGLAAERAAARRVQLTARCERRHRAGSRVAAAARLHRGMRERMLEAFRLHAAFFRGCCEWPLRFRQHQYVWSVGMKTASLCVVSIGHRPSFRGHSTYRMGLPRRRGTDTTQRQWIGVLWGRDVSGSTRGAGTAVTAGEVPQLVKHSVQSPLGHAEMPGQVWVLCGVWGGKTAPRGRASILVSPYHSFLHRFIIWPT